MSNIHLVQEIRAGRRPVYAWGLGYMFNAFQALHGLPLRKIIHTSPEKAGRVIGGVQVCGPEELRQAEAAGAVVIGYSSQYREEIQAFCRTIPGVEVIFFDDPALLDASRIQVLTTGLRTAAEHGLLRTQEREDLIEAVSAEESLDRTNCKAILAAGYDFSLEFRRDVYRALTRQVQFILHHGTPGDFAEFGTFTGTTAEFISAAMADAQTRPWAVNGGAPDKLVRNFHLFDSFDGLPEITDAVDQDAKIWQRGMYRGLNANELRRHVGKYLTPDQIKIYAGWYKDTLSSIPAGQKFALVHVDCDLYESTIDVLDYLLTHQHLSDGCAIFFDDWNCSDASPRFGERRAWAEMVEKHQLKHSDCGDYSVYGHKFLVHF